MKWRVLWCVGVVGCNPYPRWPRLDTGGPDTAVDLAGDGPALDITPTSLDFGEVERDGSKALVVVLVSTGDTDALVRDVELLSGDAFRLEQDEPAPVLLPPGEVAHLRVFFEPTASGDHDGRLFIDSDGLSGAYTMGMRGVGVDP